MKKRLLFIAVSFALTSFIAQAQDTIVAWTFPTGGLADTVADAGIADNVGSRTIMHEGGTGATQIVPGNATYAEMVTNWDNGNATKFWSIKFKAEGYHDLVLYSKQRSDATDFGPKDWKVQYKWGAIPWTDITGGTVTCTNDWAGGVVSGLSIPVTVPGGTSIYIRWIMTSNTSTNNVDVLAAGKSLIDDIVILGTEDLPVATGDTIIGFNFADTSGLEFNADFGLANNLTYDIRAEDDSAVVRTLEYTNGSTNYSATAAGWNDGANFKFWSIKFKADDYIDMKVSSKQRSGGTNPGPKYWKLQYKLGGSGTWTDVTGGNITVANDWSGALNELALPDEVDDPGTTSVYLRWVMTSNESTGGADVDSLGVSKIDDIVVTGTNTAGISNFIYENNVNIYPNPCQDILNIESSETITKTEIYNMLGARVYSSDKQKEWVKVNVNSFDSGLYIVLLHFKNESKVVSRKILID
ncbi:MAG TPA: T9SS type A sorting domain-containing protein [Bacteroidales bacterium]|nr:T9SS type A sorting domain-containing protein [Bacteroidales bacterium]